MKIRWIVRSAAVLACLATGVILCWRVPGNIAGVNRNKSLAALCSRAYTGDANAAAQVKGLDNSVLPELIALLQTRDSFLRKQVWAIMKRAPIRVRSFFSTKVSPPAAEFVRESAAHALGLLGTNASAAIPNLILALHDKEGRVCVEAGTSLGRMGKEALPALLIALQDDDAQVRLAAVSAISQIGPETRIALPGLVQRLDDPVGRVRDSAAYALTTIGIPGTLALVDIAERGSSNASKAASTVLASPCLTLRIAGSALSLMAMDESPARRTRAIRGLSHIRVERSLAEDMALHALQDPSARVRLAAIEALGAIGSQAPSTIQQLTRLTSDEEETNRVAARKALAHIEAGARN